MFWEPRFVFAFLSHGRLIRKIRGKAIVRPAGRGGAVLYGGFWEPRVDCRLQTCLPKRVCGGRSRSGNKNTFISSCIALALKMYNRFSLANFSLTLFSSQFICFFFGFVFFAFFAQSPATAEITKVLRAQKNNKSAQSVGNYQ